MSAMRYLLLLLLFNFKILNYIDYIISIIPETKDFITCYYNNVINELRKLTEWEYLFFYVKICR